MVFQARTRVGGRTAGLVVGMLLFGVGCQRITNPSAYWFAQAQALSDEGKYDDAIAAFDQLVKDYPKTPEADQVPHAVAEVLFKQAKTAWDAGKYLDAGHAYVAYGVSPGVEDTRTRDAGLFLAANYSVYYGESPQTDEGLKFGCDLSRAWSGHDFPELKPFSGEVVKWTCDSREKFPAWEACSGVSTDPGDDFAEARMRMDRAKTACEKLVPLVEMCPNDATTIKDASRGVRELDRKLTEAIIPEATAALGIYTTTLHEIADQCEERKREVKGILRDLGSDDPGDIWENPNNYASFVADPVDKLRKRLRETFDGASVVDTFVVKGLFDDTCGDLLKRATNLARQNCVYDGSRQDTSWIDDVGKSQCIPTPSVVEADDPLERIRARGSLLVAMDTGEPPGAGTPPMYFPDGAGKPDGFDYALAKAIAADIGVPDVEIVHAKYSDAEGVLLDPNAKVDLMISGYVPDDTAGVAWSQPYFDFGLCLVVAKDSPARAMKDLAGKSIGIFDDDAAAEEVERIQPAHGEIVRMEDGYWDALVAGQFAGFVYDCPYAVAELKDWETADPAHKGALTITAYNLSTSSYAVGVRAVEPDLVEAVNAAIRKWKASDAYKGAVTTYLSGGAAVDVVPTATRIVVMKDGESLASIAQRELGSSDRWIEIWMQNRTRYASPDLIKPGDKLAMP